MKRRDFLVLSAGATLSASAAKASGEPAPQDNIPAFPREFRGLWVATVTNIDWPSKSGLPRETQQQELVTLLDRAKQTGFNAVLLQVRPCCDALYRSELEPWSEYLTGTMGKDPGWDPLEFAVSEAHARGIELHAWVNPFRARQSGAKTPAAANHIAVRRRDLVKAYGTLQWLDPGEPAARQHSLDVLMDIVQRYDIDGLHLDDYFYPYKLYSDEKSKVEKPFPDDNAWKKYVSSGGTLSRSDWRRSNIDTFIRELYQQIKVTKPHVKFGISPFGIWRPGNPPQITGYDAYANLYGDSRKWMQEGWADYFSPQLYWKIEQPGQSFPVLLIWWSQQNTLSRHLWPGLYTSKYTPVEIEYQIRVTRGLCGGEAGNVHFSCASIMKGAIDTPKSMAGHLVSDIYNGPALIPPSPWLGDQAPLSPKAIRVSNGRIGWVPANGAAPFLYALQWKTADGWSRAVVPGTETSYPTDGNVERAAVAAVDRLGNTSKVALTV